MCLTCGGLSYSSQVVDAISTYIQPENELLDGWHSLNVSLEYERENSSLFPLQRLQLVSLVGCLLQTGASPLSLRAGIASGVNPPKWPKCCRYKSG